MRCCRRAPPAGATADAVWSPAVGGTGHGFFGGPNRWERSIRRTDFGSHEKRAPPYGLNVIAGVLSWWLPHSPVQSLIQSICPADV